MAALAAEAASAPVDLSAYAEQGDEKGVARLLQARAHTQAELNGALIVAAWMGHTRVCFRLVKARGRAPSGFRVQRLLRPGPTYDISLLRCTEWGRRQRHGARRGHSSDRFGREWAGGDVRSAPARSPHRRARSVSGRGSQKSLRIGGRYLTFCFVPSPVYRCQWLLQSRADVNVRTGKPRGQP